MGIFGADEQTENATTVSVYGQGGAYKVWLENQYMWVFVVFIIMGVVVCDIDSVRAENSYSQECLKYVPNSAGAKKVHLATSLFIDIESSKENCKKRNDSESTFLGFYLEIIHHINHVSDKDLVLSLLKEQLEKNFTCEEKSKLFQIFEGLLIQNYVDASSELANSFSKSSRKLRRDCFEVLVRFDLVMSIIDILTKGRNKVNPRYEISLRKYPDLTVKKLLFGVSERRADSLYYYGKTIQYSDSSNFDKLKIIYYDSFLNGGVRAAYELYKMYSINKSTKDENVYKDIEKFITSIDNEYTYFFCIKYMNVPCKDVFSQKVIESANEFNWRIGSKQLDQALMKYRIQIRDW